MELTPFVNIEVPMSEDMLHALNRHEAICVSQGIDTVTVDSTILFFTEKYNANFANQFKPEYLIAERL